MTQSEEANTVPAYRPAAQAISKLLISPAAAAYTTALFIYVSKKQKKN
jgi:hypothetical protein